MRNIKITKDFINSKNTSVLYESGNTKVLITVSISDRLPGWLENSDSGWLTAEYNMLPGSSGNRVSRKAYEGGRSKEISRLIGRSLRSICNLKLLNGYMVTVDCDVLEADGGTRTASINGSWIALNETFNKLVENGELVQNPLENLILSEDFNQYSIDITDTFTDIDMDSLQYSYSVDNSDIFNIFLDNNELVINSIQDQNGGPVNITVTADDLNRRLTISDSFEVTVNSENDAPIAYDVVLDINEDAPEIVFPDFIDIDTQNSSIELSITTDPSHGSLDIQGQGFLYSPNSNFSGVDFFTYKIFH